MTGTQLTPTLSTWIPQEQKTVNRFVVAGVSVVAITVAAFGVKAIAPTWIDALNLLQKLFASGTNMLIAGSVFLAAALLVNDIFSKDGKLGGYLRLKYNSMISKMTWELMNIDPITPLTDRRKEAQANLRVFEDAFANFDGTLRNLQETEDRYLADAKKAKSLAGQAVREVTAAKDPETQKRMKTRFDDLSYEAKQCEETAQYFSKLRARLQPIRDQILRLQEAAQQTIKRIDIDVRTTRDKWSAQQNMSRMNKAARNILRGSDKQALAQEALDIVNSRYAAEMGQLENLTSLTQPLLDSIDLEKAAYSEELLVEWERNAQLALEHQPGVVAPGMTTEQAIPVGDFRKLIG